MTSGELKATAQSLVADGKGLLAAARGTFAGEPAPLV
ncbi:fructose-bisphosphate aldolase [Defluviicoccus vanus]|nr:fructose-bisphosphate aldolase [Defluviicoccus vanus]